MLRNPCCPAVYFGDFQADTYMRYRRNALARLPGLEYLDSTEVTAAERTEAQRCAGLFFRLSVCLFARSLS